MKKGFTLIEILVSVSIFSIVMIISIGAILSIDAANRKAQTVRTAMDNLNFALESMAREMRVGSSYYCSPENATISGTQDCSGTGASGIARDGGESITFLNSAGDRVWYKLLANGSIGKFTGNVLVSDDQFIGLTAPEITITELRFYVSGSAPGDRLQPRVLLLVSGFAGKAGDRAATQFHLETTISQRLIDS